MASEWKELTIAEMAEVVGGGTPSTKDPSNFGDAIPWITPKDLSGYEQRYISRGARNISEKGLASSSAKLLPQGAVLLTTRAPVGYVAIAQNPVSTNQGFRSLIPRKGFDSDFLYYLLSLHTEFLKSQASGTTFGELAGSTLKALQFRVPSLALQRAIAHVLGTLNDKIELNRRMNETLEQMAVAIFKSWFVDFDPVRAKLALSKAEGAEGRPTGLPREIEDLFPAEFEETELGEVPEGREVSTVGAEFNLTMGQSPPGTTYNETGDGIPFFQGKRDFGFRYPTNRVYCTAPTRFADEGDTLVSVRAPVGDVNMAMEKCCVGRGVAAIRHKIGSRSYTYYAMRSLTEVFQDFEAEGTVFGCINKADFQGIKHVVPPAQLVEKFEAMVFPFDQTIEKNIREIVTLAAIRDTLLPKLLSGEIEAPAVEEMVEEAVATPAAEAPEEIMVDVAEPAPAPSATLRASVADFAAAKEKKRGARKANPTFEEAILISALVKELGSAQYPLGRKRYTKFSYLVHRKAGHDVSTAYLKQAAGPYNPRTKYGRAEGIALDNGYVQLHKRGKYSGFVAGPNVTVVDRYLERRDYKDALAWIIKKFRKTTNEWLGLLTTVDKTALELNAAGQPITPKHIRVSMAQDKEWRKKIGDPFYSEANIGKALNELQKYFKK